MTLLRVIQIAGQAEVQLMSSQADELLIQEKNRFLLKIVQQHGTAHQNRSVQMYLFPERNIVSVQILCTLTETMRRPFI